MSRDGVIDEIAGLLGIATHYADAFGRSVAISRDTRQAILTAFGLCIETEADARASLAQVEALRRGVLAALIPLGAEQRTRLPLNGVEEAAWRLTLESGVALEGFGRGGALDLPALPMGYHRLSVESAGARAEATVVAAPAACWEPDDMAGGARLWGITAQVYGLRSPRSLGIGDYSDVAALARGAGLLRASFLGLSPVHALFSADRTKISPYSPSSRLMLETLFLDPAAVPGFRGSSAARLLAEASTQARLKAVRETPLVDHEAAWALKRPLLEALWQEIGRHGEDPAFAAFRRDGGEALEAHATFEALSEHFRHEGRWWLGDWPAAFHDAGSADVRRFRAANDERVAFHAWLQWLCDVQFSRASAAARKAGMSLGVYRDLAVGADPGGSEIWAHPDRYAAALSAGAPPDPLGPLGQNWGLPPFNPLALERQGLAAFRDLVAANMRHAGAIRIDHAFQLRRLFLIPAGMTAGQGAYVDFPFEAMLAVLRVESHRRRCLVIAEDLGTAPHAFSGAIMTSGILSYRVLWFERAGGGHGGGAGFVRPGDYPSRALAAFTTHDLPTFAAWWLGLDINLRESLGVHDAMTAERERESRAADRRFFAQALADEGLLPDQEPPELPPLEAMIRYLARTASSLVALQLEDVLGELNQANLPGPDVGHPNWRRRLSADVPAIVAPGGDLAKLAAAIGAEGRGQSPQSSALSAPPPRATYRLQLHRDFTFDDAAAVVPYLARLGISHVYASPIHQARPGSVHGYDIVDHAAINPELGGEAGFVRLSEALKRHGLGLILDIVPNHKGVGGADNGWWLSVLEWGELSPHGRAFDIDWQRLGAHGKLVVPILNDRYGEALEKGDLKLAFDAGEGSFSVWHAEHRLPVSPLAYPIILDRALAALDDEDGAGRAHMQAISESLRAMAEDPAAERRAGFVEEAQRLKERLAQAVAASPSLQVAVERAVSLIGGMPGEPDSFNTLHRILEMQAYRPAYWRVAASDINYRRFFDINALAGLRVEDPQVFDRVHALVFRLVEEGRVHGFRIDHIDGLADPEAYTRSLQSVVGPGFYVAVEKILEPGEALRPWPVAGTTGYDALNLIDGIFVDTANAEAFERLYRSSSGLEGRYGALLREAKAEVLETSFASELEVLVSDIKRIADADRRTRDYAAIGLRQALIEIVARLPVYRSYLQVSGESGSGSAGRTATAPPSPEDRRLIDDTVAAARRRSALPDRTVHAFIAAALLGEIETEGAGRPDPELVRRFRCRFQQLTGPVMAKSLEDTLFYRYVRLASLNEVGGDPSRFGGTLAAFHAENAGRAAAWPHAMTATATHDTKWGEDVRARLNALSEMPEGWREALQRFERIAAGHLRTLEGEDAPDANDRYLLLQALLGAWPVDLLEDAPAADAVQAFRERMQVYLVKALREAKRHTSWIHAHEAYEDAAAALVSALLDHGGVFLDAFRPLARRLAELGVLTGLARTALKVTLPGVPDIYQGTEFWDLSLVDPDNRRPVDYAARRQALEHPSALPDLLAGWRDGRVKQALIARLLADRTAHAALYAHGDYQPLPASGEAASHVVAFTRSHGGESLLAAVPRLVAGLSEGDTFLRKGEAWRDTAVAIPAGRWRDILTERDLDGRPGGVPVRELFCGFPLAVLRMRA